MKNNKRFEEFYQASQRDLARAKAFAESISEYPLDEEDVRIMKLAFPKASFKFVGATFGAYDEEYHEQLLHKWREQQLVKIDEVRNSSHQNYLARVESSSYFGWVKVDYYPIKEGEKESYGYSTVTKDELVELLKEEVPYIDAGYEIVNEYVLKDLGDKIDPANFVYLEEAGFNI